LKREIHEEVGIDFDLYVNKVEQMKDDSVMFQYEFKKVNNLNLEPLMAYESIYPETIEIGPPSAHTLINYFIVKINDHKDNIITKMQLSEISAYAWININDLNRLFNKFEGDFEAFVESDGIYHKTILKHDHLNSWEKEMKEGIPWGHRLAINEIMKRLNIY